MGKKKQDAGEDVEDEHEQDEEEEEEESGFTVERIIDMRVKSGKKEYLLKWKGYPE
jgi:hypothetical protein